MGSLRSLVDSISNALGKDTDVPFRKKVEEDIISTRTTLIRRNHEREGRFSDNSIIELVDVPLEEIDTDTVMYQIKENDKYLTKRTKYKIPFPCRVKSNEPFVYVGDDDWMTPAAYIDTALVTFLSAEELATQDMRYSYVNGYIYTFFQNLDNVSIKYVPEDLREHYQLINTMRENQNLPLIMDIKIEKGIKGNTEKIVGKNDTADHYGSGLIQVFATPAMIALMEKTALESILPYLPAGFGTVGTSVNIKHIKATPIGKKVWCETELIEIDRKKLIFSVKARDEQGEIGNGTHTRFIINNDEFMKKISF